MTPRTVVVTGLGAVSPLGLGVPALWEALLAGRSGVRAHRGTRRPPAGDGVDPRACGPEGVEPWDEIDLGEVRTWIGAPIAPGLDLSRLGYAPKDLKTLDRACWYALAAAHEALDSAGLAVEPRDERHALFRVRGVDPDRVAVSIGSGVGGLTSFEAVHRHWTHHATFRGSAWMRYGLPMLIPNAPAANVAIRLGLRGECRSTPTACAAGTMSIGDAYRLLRSGEADMALAGGAEAVLTDHDGLGLAGFDNLRVMSTRNDEPERASRPFDRDRDGFVLGEGAGVLVLETAEHARARGARPHAEILSYASTCDAHSMMQPDPDGAMVQRAFDLALRRAQVPPSAVGYVNAHATSTPAGDRVEAHALRRVFGGGSSVPAVSATKSMTGHCVGASGALEAIVTVQSLREGVLHATLNLDDVDPACELDHVQGAPRLARIDFAMSASFGFGGHDAVLTMARI